MEEMTVALPTHLSRWRHSDPDETRAPSTVWLGSALTIHSFLILPLKYSHSANILISCWSYRIHEDDRQEFSYDVSKRNQHRWANS